MELFKKRHGQRYDAEERARKKESRAAHDASTFAQKAHGLRAILHNKQRYKEKAAMKKT